MQIAVMVMDAVLLAPELGLQLTTMDEKTL
jgi:hypothetical protein